MFGQPLQFVRNEMLTALWRSRLQLNGECSSALLRVHCHTLGETLS